MICQATVRYVYDSNNPAYRLPDAVFQCQLEAGHEGIHLGQNPVTIVTWTTQKRFEAKEAS